MKRNAFGQLFGAAHPSLRLADGDGSGGGTFTPPATQEALDAIINGAVARAHKQYEGFEDYKAKAAKFDSEEAAKSAAAAKDKKSDDNDAPAGVTSDDVDKRIGDALAAKDLELGLERVNDALDKALEGRAFSPSLLITVDRKTFVKDGKHADADAIKEWVEKNSKAIDTPEPRRRQIPGQGDRDGNATGGSVTAGRDLYTDNHTKSGKD